MQQSDNNAKRNSSGRIEEYPDDALQDVHAQLMREKTEPSEGFSPLPMFMLFIFGTLVFWGGIYIAQYSGGFDPLIYNEHLKPVEKIVAAGPEAPFDYIAHGKKIFNRDCIACHQASGMGVPGVFPPLVDSHWVNGNVKLPANIVITGLMGPITVKGTDYNSVMPPLGSLLGDRDVAAVLSYIRQDWGNNADPVTEEVIAEVRAEFESRTDLWTIEELLSVYPQE